MGQRDGKDGRGEEERRGAGEREVAVRGWGRGQRKVRGKGDREGRQEGWGLGEEDGEEEVGGNRGRRGRGNR